MRKTRRNVIVADSGNVFLYSGFLPQLKAQAAIEALAAMDYTALNIGHADFVFGDKFVFDISRDYSLPVLSANLIDNATGAGIAQGHKIISFDAFNVGLIGVVAQHNQAIITEYTAASGRSIKVLNETDTLIKKTEELKNQADIILVLADVGIEKARQLARDVPGIHVIVCSGGYVRTDSPIVVNGVYIVEAGTSGEGIGNLTLSIDENGVIQSGQGTVITLSDTVPEAVEVAAIIDSFHKGLKKFADELIVKDPQEPEQGWYYTGAVVCAQCHVSQSGQWRVTGHPKAFTALVERSQDYNPECIACHITGYGYAGGFELPDTTPERTGVQCEMCHGPGGEHAETLAVPYGKITRDICITCHTQDHSPYFDYEAYKDKIAHDNMTSH